MHFRNIIIFKLFILLLGFKASAAYSAVVTYNFERVTNNNVEDLSNQLSVSLWDHSQANSEFGLSLTSTQVLFSIQNDVGIASSIAEVYFDDGLLGPASIENSLSGNTNFSGGSANPSNLPGGNTIGFMAIGPLSADVNPGPPNNGVNQSADTLGIVISLGSFADFNAVQTAIDNGYLRVGYHVRSIGQQGGSDSYVNSAIPLPAAAWMFISALAGLVVLRRTK